MTQRNKWTDELLIESVKKSTSISSTLRNMGLSVSGGNFYLIPHRIKELQLDTSHWNQPDRSREGDLIRTETQKRCSICKEFKNFEEFFKANSSKDGYSGWCKECKRERQRTQNWAKNHGMTDDEYQRMVEAQGNRCAICNKTPELNRWKRLYVDHRHSDNAPRGLLCSSCNQALGLFQDNPELLEKAATYLRNW